MTTIRIPDRALSIPASVPVDTPFSIGAGVINKEINEPILQGSNCGSILGGDGEKVDVTLTISFDGSTEFIRTETVCALYGLETIDLAQTVEFDGIKIEEPGSYTVNIQAETQRKLGEGNFASAGPFTLTVPEPGEAPAPPEEDGDGFFGNGDGDGDGDGDKTLVQTAIENPGATILVLGVGGLAIRSAFRGDD